MKNTPDSKEALIIVDYTGGFADKRLQELYVQDGETLAPIITEEIQRVRTKGGKIIVTRDWHNREKLMNFALNYTEGKPFSSLTWDDVKDWTEEDNWLSPRAQFTVEQVQQEILKNGEIKLWWDHSIANTEGAYFYQLDTELFDAKVRKGEDYVESYSGFWGFEEETRETLDEVLKRFQIEVVKIVWLATDYCVKETALDSRKNGYKTQVLMRWVRAVTSETEQQALRELQAAGVEIIYDIEDTKV